jgi:hypothetical protein
MGVVIAVSLSALLALVIVKLEENCNIATMPVKEATHISQRAKFGSATALKVAHGIGVNSWINLRVVYRNTHYFDNLGL